MRSYLDLLLKVLEQGTRQKNRTGIDTFFIPGAMMQFDLTHGFPIVTTKKIAWNACKGEMLAHLRGAASAAEFRELGCGFWDANANENKSWLANANRIGKDDLGRIYGVQWRGWRGSERTASPFVDQVSNALETIRDDPTNRRIIISGWRPDEMNEMALPPCHVLYQFLVNVERRELNLCMYQRSCDMFLGVPMNISGAALMLVIFATLTGLRPRMFTHFLADVHIYENHMAQVAEQLSRTPLSLPQIIMRHPFERLRQRYRDVEPNLVPALTLVRQLEEIEPDDIQLAGYEFLPAIKAEMAV